MPRFISTIVALIAVIALFSAGGYVLARWYEWDAVAGVTMFSLKWSLYAVVACCVYAGLVGVYHTILSVTGLDEEREAITDARQNGRPPHGARAEPSARSPRQEPKA